MLPKCSGIHLLPKLQDRVQYYQKIRVLHLFWNIEVIDKAEGIK